MSEAFLSSLSVQKRQLVCWLVSLCTGTGTHLKRVWSFWSQQDPACVFVCSVVHLNAAGEKKKHAGRRASIKNMYEMQSVVGHHFLVADHRRHMLATRLPWLAVVGQWVVGEPSPPPLAPHLLSRVCFLKRSLMRSQRRWGESAAGVKVRGFALIISPYPLTDRSRQHAAPWARAPAYRTQKKGRASATVLGWWEAERERRN